MADTVNVALRGLMGQMFREGNALKVKRGMTGLVGRGLSAGGRAYGYRPVLGKTGELMIVEDEAEIVRRIFTELAGGKSAQALARELTQEGVPGPRAEPPRDCRRPQLLRGRVYDDQDDEQVCTGGS